MAIMQAIRNRIALLGERTPAELERLCFNNDIKAIPGSDTDGIIQRVLRFYNLNPTGQIARYIRYLDDTEYILLPRSIAIFIIRFNMRFYPRIIDPADPNYDLSKSPPQG